MLQVCRNHANMRRSHVTGVRYIFCCMYTSLYSPRVLTPFSQLLALLGIGFLQGLYALDAADGTADHPREVINLLIQALLQ
jgi:hypothetical protein